MSSFYLEEELKNLGFKKLGINVLISKKASIYGAENISIGNNVRIDDFCILSGAVELGNYIHIAAATLLFGGIAGIMMDDFSTISSRSAIYAISDDYSGKYMTNPTIEEKYKNTINKSVSIGKHVVIGTNSTILPGVSIESGVAIGACSLITRNCKGWGIYVGTPAIRIKDRDKDIVNLEKKFLENFS